jgi:hypothetical protein
VERRAGVDSFSIEVRTLFEVGSSKESPALFLERIGESGFVGMEGDGFVWLRVDTAWVVDGSGDTGREGGNEMGGEGGGDTGHEGGSEPGREGGNETGGEGGGDTGREGGNEPGRGGTSSISTSGP